MRYPTFFIAAAFRRAAPRFLTVLGGASLLAAPAAQAQKTPLVSLGFGTNYLMPKQQRAGGDSFIKDATPTLHAQLELPTWPRLHPVARLRLGTFGTQLRGAEGSTYQFSDYTLQPGAGLRYVMLGAGHTVQPFVGLNVSAGFLLFSQHDFYSTRWLAAAGAEAGVTVQLSARSGLSVAFEAQRSLTTPYAPLRYTAPPTRNPAGPPAEVQARFVPGYGSLLLGWHWQLPKPPVRPQTHTPRYGGPVEREWD